MLRDPRGTSILEFALVAAPFFALLIAIVETSLVFFAQEALETAAEAAARELMTGQAQQASESQSQFKTDACKSLPVFLSCANLMVDVTTADSFADAVTTAPDLSKNPSNTWSYQPGVAGDIVVMRLMYVWPVPPGPLSFDLSNLSGHQRLLLATSVLKTENYQ